MINHPHAMGLAVFLSIVVLMMAICWRRPLWSHPGIFFSVSVEPGFADTEEARRIVMRYRFQAFSGLGVAFALILAAFLSSHAIGLFLGLLFLIFGPPLAFAQAHKRALRHAVAVSSVRAASLVPRSRQLPGGWLVQFGPFVILLLTALYLSAHWEQIPPRFPVHWGPNGQPNGWATRTPSGVFDPLVYGACMVLFISVLGYIGSHAARRSISRSGLSADDHANRIAVVNLAIEYFVALTFAAQAMTPLIGSPNLALIVTLGLVVALAFVFFRAGRSKAASLPDSGPGDGTPDSCWKWGLFYFNPEDSAVVIEKRVGIGYSLNFARPAAWVLALAMVFVPVGVAIALSLWKD